MLEAVGSRTAAGFGLGLQRLRGPSTLGPGAPFVMRCCTSGNEARPAARKRVYVCTEYWRCGTRAGAGAGRGAVGQTLSRYEVCIRMHDRLLVLELPGIPTPARQDEEDEAV
jgi:hypothetical protein